MTCISSYITIETGVHQRSMITFSSVSGAIPHVPHSCVHLTALLEKSAMLEMDEIWIYFGKINACHSRNTEVPRNPDRSY